MAVAWFESASLGKARAHGLTLESELQLRMILEPNKASSPSKGQTADLGLITLAKTLFLNKVPFADIAG